MCLPAEPLGLRKYFVCVILKRDSLTLRLNTPHEFAAVGVETPKDILRSPERSHRNSRHPRYDSYFRSDKIISTWKWRTQPYVANVVSQKFAYELSVPTMHGVRKLASAVPPDCFRSGEAFQLRHQDWHPLKRGKPPPLSNQRRSAAVNSAADSRHQTSRFST